MLINKSRNGLEVLKITVRDMYLTDNLSREGENKSGSGGQGDMFEVKVLTKFVFRRL